MVRQKKKASVLSAVLDLIDAADTAVERFTGKNMASWLKGIREESQLGAGAADKGILQSATTTTDPYAVLGLPPTASLEEVKNRYRQLSMIYHPDRKGGYTEAMKRLNEAYERIKKEKKAQ